MVKRAVGIKTNGVEITPLGSEIHAAGIIYDAAADIALYIIYGVNDAAGYGVYGVQHRSGAIAVARAVIGTKYRANVVHICAYPVITACMRPEPRCVLGFKAVCGVFIGYGEAGKILLFGFAAPCTGVNIAVIVSYGRYGLVTYGFGHPKAFQRIRTKRLYVSIIKLHKHHSLGINHRVGSVAT